VSHGGYVINLRQTQFLSPFAGKEYFFFLWELMSVTDHVTRIVQCTEEFSSVVFGLGLLSASISAVDLVAVKFNAKHPSLATSPHQVGPAASSVKSSTGQKRSNVPLPAVPISAPFFLPLFNPHSVTLLTSSNSVLFTAKPFH
jgi:hypothetical protein